MPKKLEQDFNIFCNSQNLEVNYNQILVIKKLQDFYKKNYKSLFSNFFSKDNLKSLFESL